MNLLLSVLQDSIFDLILNYWFSILHMKLSTYFWMVLYSWLEDVSIDNEYEF